MKYLLLPFSYIYGAIAWLRNKLYDTGVLTSYTSNLSTVVIGNLQVGGSGKTPMTAFLYKAMSKNRKLAILSRGYGRKTKGLIIADENANADQIGDEPFWYHSSFPEAMVVVSESRKIGLQCIEKSDSELVLLDDAFQHRAIRADVNIMLSEFSKPYYSDYPMPAGRLREFRTGDKRADLIIFTKCPMELSKEEKIARIQAVNLLDNQEVYFTGLHESEPIPLKGNTPFNQRETSAIVAVSGIANPESFINLCKKFNKELIIVSYKDHYDYSVADIEELQSIPGNPIIICTEKDAVKLRQTKLYSILKEDTYFCLPVETYFLFGEEQKFMKSLEGLLKKKN